MGTGFAFCLTLNAGGQKKTVPIIFPTSGMPLKRTKSAFFRVSIFKKWQFTTPIFGLFSPLPNCETLINSHFQFLRRGNFSQKRVIFEG